MIDANTLNSIRQKRFDSLTAKHLHVRARGKLNVYSTIVDGLALGVPIVYFVFRYLAKGTQYDTRVEVAWEILASLLLVLTIAKLLLRWTERGQQHSRLLGENISFVQQADSAISDPTNCSSQTATLLLALAAKSEGEDRNALGELKPADSQFAYREALKENTPGDATVVCPVCKASPWTFKQGSCQLCGNTPKTT